MSKQSCGCCNGGIVLFDGQVRACKCGLFETDADALAAVGALVLALGSLYRAGPDWTVADAADVLCDDRDDRTCPGWFVADDGGVEPCPVCQPPATTTDGRQAQAEESYQRAHAWTRELPVHPRHPRPEDTMDGCEGCCGFDIFDVRGSVHYHADSAVLREDGCGGEDTLQLFNGDLEAADCARELYAQRYKPCARPREAGSTIQDAEGAGASPRPKCGVAAKQATFSVLAEVEASALFADENVNWKYCIEHATFAHKDDDACEFILHIGDGPGSESHADEIIAQMKVYGCTAPFIDAYTQARDAGALRVLFHT